MKVYLFLIVSMKSLGKATLNTLIGLSIAASVNAQGPNKTEDYSQSTKKALIENVEMQKIDQTATIMKCMAGMLTKEELEKLLVDNGYRKNDVKYITMKPDTLLYHTLQELRTKYGYPNITFERPKMVGEEYDGHFSKRKDVIQINLKNILNNIKQNKENGNIDFQGEMLDIGLMELSHKIQDITFKKKRKDFRTLVKLNFDYDEMYDTPGTIENEAHEKLEKQVYNDFLEMYASRIDTTDAEQVERADYCFDRYAYTKTDKMPNNAQLDFMLKREDERELNKMRIQK